MSLSLVCVCVCVRVQECALLWQNFIVRFVVDGLVVTLIITKLAHCTKIGLHTRKLAAWVTIVDRGSCNNQPRY